MKNITGVGLFLAGAGLGFVAGSFALKHKYEKLMDDAVQSVKDTYSKKRTVNNIPKMKKTETAEDRVARKEAAQNDPEIAEFTSCRKEENYVDYGACATPPENMVVVGKDDPKSADISIVTADEFEEDDTYRTVSLSYYRDDILADEHDEVVDMPEILLGNLTPGELLTGNDTEVFLKNNTRQIYVEIVKDDRLFYGDIIPDEGDC